MAKFKKAFTYIIVFLLLAVILVIAYKNRVKLGKIISPFFMGLVIAYLLHPIAIRMEHKKIKRGIAIVILYVFFLIALGATMFFVFPTIVANTKELINTIPNIASQYEAYFRGLLLTISSSTWPAEVKETIMREISMGARTLQYMVVGTLKKSLTYMLDIIFSLFDLVLAMIIAYYYLKDADYLKEGFLSLTPRKWRNFLIGAGREINLILSNFIQGQLLTALIVGIMESIGLMLIHAKYPVVLGMVGGIFNIIPYFGPFLGAIPAVAVSLIDSPLKALWTSLVFIIVQQIDNAFISPKIIEGRLGLHPVTTILAVLVGGEFAGILGMLVAVPIAAILKVIIKRTIEIIV